VLNVTGFVLIIFSLPCPATNTESLHLKWWEERGSVTESGLAAAWNVINSSIEAARKWQEALLEMDMGFIKQHVVH
jgi:hypothetical protein